MNKQPKETKRRRSHKPLWWRGAEGVDRGIEQLGQASGSWLERFEWTVHRLLQWLLFLSMPWKWFRKRPTRLEDGVEEFPPDGTSNISDSLEWFFDRLMPWRWFSRQSRAENENEFPAEDKVAISDALEWTFHRILPWRWFDKPGTIVLDGNDEKQRHDKVGPVEAFEWRVSQNLHFLFKAIQRVASTLIPRSIIHKTEDAQIAMAQSAELATSTSSQMLPYRVFWPAYWLFDRLIDAVDFAGYWSYSRRYHRLIWAVPACLLIGIVAFVFLGALRYPNSARIIHYRRALSSAETQGDEEAGQFIRQKLIQLGDYIATDPTVPIFQRALRRAESGDFEAAFIEMQQLASADAPGFLHAHLWIAGAILDGKINVESPWSLIELHTNHALQLDADNSLGKRFRVEVLLHQQDWQQASVEMEAVCESFPNYFAVMCDVQQKLGNEEKSLIFAQRAANHYEASVDATKQHSRSLENFPLAPIKYMRLAKAYTILNEPMKGLAVLKVACQEHPDDDLVRSTYLQALTLRLSNTSVDNHAAASKLVPPICRLDPENTVMMNYLGRGILKKSEFINELVTELHAKRLLPGSFFERVADTLLSTNRRAEALDFYKKTFEIAPRSGRAWNNVACILRDANKLDDALKAANRAIDCERHAYFLETRGQILLELKRWGEAVEDLEQALNGADTLSLQNQIHQALATSYEALGNPEQARAHGQKTR